MRHGKKFNHLGRKTAHRKAMLANMASSLIEHKRINTTLAKAKALRQFVEPIITKSKEDTTHNRRTAFRYLRNKYAVTELFKNVSQKVADRPGGYLRIIKLGNRLGDNADMAMVEFVDYNEIYNPNAKKTKTTRRSRRKKSTANAETTTKEEVVEAKVEEAKTEVKEAKVEVKETKVEVKETKAKKKSDDEKSGE